ncbi:hypothetical protein CEXT_161371 [Caerostris extrusa]|uniref:Uncharacterized protein n=1 Tax=Caerostris extrusa TaxID=172846 RepID=A0AAV4P169_CAEEX|nr:hypothetical protein CEXT_161371 [Caerostris extrusa]
MESQPSCSPAAHVATEPRVGQRKVFGSDFAAKQHHSAETKFIYKLFHHLINYLKQKNRGRHKWIHKSLYQRLPREFFTRRSSPWNSANTGVVKLCAGESRATLHGFILPNDEIRH